MKTIELGQKVKGKVNEKNELPEDQWIDEQLLEWMNDGILTESKSIDGGGFRNHPGS